MKMGNPDCCPLLPLVVFCSVPLSYVCSWLSIVIFPVVPPILSAFIAVLSCFLFLILRHVYCCPLLSYRWFHHHVCLLPLVVFPLVSPWCVYIAVPSHFPLGSPIMLIQCWSQLFSSGFVCLLFCGVFFYLYLDLWWMSLQLIMVWCHGIMYIFSFTLKKK